MVKLAKILPKKNKNKNVLTIFSWWGLLWERKLVSHDGKVYARP